MRAQKWVTAIGIGLLGAAGLALTATPARAATATTTFTVTANVPATCVITANPLNFGTYTGVQVTATTTLNVTCTNTTTYNVGLNQGSASGATVTTRAMTGSNGGTLNYSLYQDQGLSKNWGNTAGTDTVSGTGNGSAQPITVYGEVPAGQYPTPGTYTDTVTATVYY